MTLAQLGVWETTEKEEPLFWNLKGGLFVSAYCSRLKKGMGFALAQKDFKKERLAQAVSDLSKHFSPSDLSTCEIKAIGSSSLVVLATDLFSKSNLQIKSVVKKDSPEIEILFYATTGRVRIAAQASVTPLTKVKVLIVDDSPTILKLLKYVLSSDPAVEVVATAELPSQVEALILAHQPHVLTLDIHMPEMNGVELLKKLHPKYKIPTIMISSISIDEGPLVLEALESGAVDYFQKPSMESIDAVAPLILEKIKTVANAKLQTNRGASQPIEAQTEVDLDAIDVNRVIAIGSSTGGTEALREVLTRLPTRIPPILIVQHIPPVFSQAFASRMNDLCPFEVKEATDGDEVLPGRVLIAPGGKQMKISSQGGTLKVIINDDAPVNRFKPSADYLFDSVAKEIGKKAIGVILTGMGSDGAKGLLKMKQSGARTVAQDEASCVVFGMPKEAIRLGAAEKISDLFLIPRIMMGWVSEKKRKVA